MRSWISCLALLTHFFVALAPISPAHAITDPPDSEAAFQARAKERKKAEQELDEFFRENARRLADTFERYALQNTDGTLSLPREATLALNNGIRSEIQRTIDHFFEHNLKKMLESKAYKFRAAQYFLAVASTLFPLVAVGLIVNIPPVKWLETHGEIVDTLMRASVVGVYASIVAVALTLVYPDYKMKKKISKVEADPEFREKVIKEEGHLLLPYDHELRRFSAYFLAEMARRHFVFNGVSKQSILHNEMQETLWRKRALAITTGATLDGSHHIEGGYDDDGVLDTLKETAESARLGGEAVNSFIKKLSLIAQGAETSICELWLTR